MDNFENRTEQNRTEQNRTEQNRTEQNRTDNIDILKAICAFLIVCIHIPFPGTGGAYFTALTRIAVPIFFMITGFFYKDTLENEREGGQILKIARLALVTNLIYLIWNLSLELIKGEGMFVYLTETFNLNNLLKFLLLNESPFSSHLWYLGAILYVLVIVFILERLHCRKLLYWITPFLLVVDLLLGKYSIVLFHREFPYILVRNFLFVGIPYFCIGCIIRLHCSRLKRFGSMMPFCIGLFAITSLLERFILENAGLNAIRDHYISTTFLAIAVFLFTLSLKEDVKQCQSGRILANIGRKYSTWIYILHPIFIRTIGTVMSITGIYAYYRLVASVIVYACTVLFLICYANVIKCIGLFDKK